MRERELEDACQEVFIVVHARLADFEGRSTLRTWLYGIAMRVALNQRRKSARRREDLEAWPPEGESAATQHELTEQRETLGLVERALLTLDEDKREVFALYELEGMTMAEVAGTLAVAENTALYRLYAARDEIRSFLRGHERDAGSARALEARRTAP